jgi:hypothetical protein
MMKKLTFVVLLAAVAALVSGQNSGLVTDFTNPAAIPLVTNGNFVLRGTVLVQYTGRDKNLSIPAGLGITEIGENALGHSGVETLVLPAGLQKIGRNAFSSSYSLASVSIPGSVAVIGEEAFSGCSRLTTVNFQEGRLAVIGNHAFYNCSALARVIMPPGLSVIMDNAFDSCRNLVSVTIPDSVVAIGSQTFNNCEKLISINLPENIIYISNTAINGNLAAAYINSGKRAGRYNFSRGFNTWFTGSNPIPQALAVSPGTPVQAVFDPAGRENWFRFGAPADGGMLNAQTGGSIDTRITLYDSNGNELASDDDSGTGYNAMINTFVLEGTYYIKVTGSRGNYSLSVTLE